MTPTDSPSPQSREAAPSDEELNDLAMRCCGVLHGDVLHMDRRQRIAFARAVLAATLPSPAIPAGTADLRAPALLPESMNRDEVLVYYSQYANMVAHEVIGYQRQIRELRAALAATAAAPLPAGDVALPSPAALASPRVEMPPGLTPGEKQAFMLGVAAATAAAPSAPEQPISDERADAIHSMPWVRDCLLRYVDRPCDKEARDVVRAITNAQAGLMVGAQPPVSPSAPEQPDWRQAFERAMKQTWGMVDPLKPPGQPGSYWRGEHNGIVGSLQTLRENFERELRNTAPSPVSLGKADTRDCEGVGGTDGR